MYFVGGHLIIYINLYYLQEKLKMLLPKIVNDIFLSFRDFNYNLSEKLFDNIAKLFGYPDSNLGMPVSFFRNEEHYYRANLPIRKIYREPFSTISEVLFGQFPSASPNSRLYYANDVEGYYNIYFEDYRNLYMLPNRISEFIQINYNICLDTSFIEGLREGAFVSIVLYQMIISFRLSFSWFITINPYTYPWRMLIALVDWIDESFGGFIPSIAGVNITGMVFSVTLGKCSDALNHLIFTMPYLPNEGQKATMVVNEAVTKVKLFHYLPYLWYKYPIPNEVREFWYYKRPDILDYMMKTYSELNIQWLPDSITQEPTYSYSTIDLLIKIFFK